MRDLARQGHACSSMALSLDMEVQLPQDDKGLGFMRGSRIVESFTLTPDVSEVLALSLCLEV